MKNETAIFGGGCFWCTEAILSRLKGVVSISSGYSGGNNLIGKKNPTYEEVCSGKSGYAEVVKIEFDSDILSYETLLSVFFSSHDPTTLNRQGNDEGTQYRSVIFYTSEKQKRQAENYVQKLKEDKIYSAPIVTEIAPSSQFHEAEDYHQKYFDNNQQAPYCQFIINPKINKLKEKYKNFLKE
jgi:peptide-methionine (S)-S-oxide reductase